MKRYSSQAKANKLMNRILMMAVSLVIALGLILLLYPFLHDSALIYAVTQADGGSPREINILASRAESSGLTRWRLERRLTSETDRVFRGAAMVLNTANLLDVPGRDVTILDRYQTLQFASTRSAIARELMMHMACGIDRNNAYRQDMATIAAEDELPSVRQLAALLAAKVGQTQVLAALMGDTEPAVRAKAYMDAAIIGAGDILLAAATDPDPSAYAYQAWAVAHATGELHSDLPATIDALTSLPDPSAEQINLLNRLIFAASEAEADTAAVYLTHLITQYQQAGRPMPAMLLLAGANLGLEQIAPDVRNVLAAVEPGQSVPLATLTAAIAAADRLGLPVRAEMYTVVDLIWSEQHQHLCLDAALALGRQAELDQAGREAPSREACVRLLQQMATWSYYEPPADDEYGPGRVVNSPLASAGATLALWRLDVPLSDMYVGNATTSSFTSPGDFLAWQIGRESPEEGMALGLRMIPALVAPPEERVYNEHERAAGAMMLALSARTDEQCAQAINRINERLYGTTLGGEDNYRIRMIYKCALQLAGDEQYHDELRDMLPILELPRRPLLTALLGSGDRYALDWMLWNRQFNDVTVFQFLLGQQLADVLDVVTPSLPALDRAAPNTVRMFQLQILRDTYVINRATVEIQPLR